MGTAGSGTDHQPGAGISSDPEIAHTSNSWRSKDSWRMARKSATAFYKMTCSVWEDTKYDRETKQSIPVAWYVTWDVYVNSPKKGYGEKLPGRVQKRYTDKTAAMEVPGRPEESLFSFVHGDFPLRSQSNINSILPYMEPFARIYRGRTETGKDCNCAGA